MMKIENYELPRSKARSEGLVLSIAVLMIGALLALSFGLIWLILVFGSFLIQLYFMIFVDTPRYKAYRDQYRQTLDTLPTDEILSSIDGNELNTDTKKLLEDYLDKYRSGWRTARIIG